MDLLQLYGDTQAFYDQFDALPVAERLPFVKSKTGELLARLEQEPDNFPLKFRVYEAIGALIAKLPQVAIVSVGEATVGEPLAREHPVYERALNDLSHLTLGDLKSLFALAEQVA
ncbi:MAG TPA: hypothetical protein VKB67_14610 [Rhizomicrobium sp.]|nr:hypothetical protein [Rhizomicrobium sp.]